MNFLWGGRSEFDEFFTPEQIEKLNSNYFCFGYYMHDSDAYTYLVFDKDGKFMRLYYDQDRWDNAQNLFNSLLKKSSANLNFNQMISSLIDDVIQALKKDSLGN
jgi:hypothetical protein